LVDTNKTLDWSLSGKSSKSNSKVVKFKTLNISEVPLLPGLVIAL